MTGTSLVRLQERQELAELARSLHATGAFGADDAGQAYAKVLAGREYGLPPVAALNSFHVVKRKDRVAGVEPSAEFLAARVKAHPVYDYRVTRIDDQECVIRFIDRTTGELLGESSFSQADAQQAGLLERGASGKPGAWELYPRNMLFARAMTNGVSWFVPDVIRPLPLEGEPIVGEGAEHEAVGRQTGASGDTVPSPSDADEVVEGELVEDVEGAEGRSRRSHEDATPSADPAAAGGAEPVDGDGDPEPEAGEEPTAQPASGAAAPKGATRGQLSKLAVLAGKLGMDETERHEAAGVDSFKALTRDEASVLIDQWERETASSDSAPSSEGQESEETSSAGGVSAKAPAGGDVAEGSGVAPGEAGAPDPDGPITQETVSTILAMYGGSVAKARQTAEAFGKGSLGELTEDQGQQLLVKLREMVAEASAQQEIA